MATPMIAERMGAMVDSVAQHFGVSDYALLGPSRSQVHVRLRHLAMALCYEVAQLPVDEIARHFQRQRATVYYALQNHHHRLRQRGNEDLRRAWARLKQEYIRMNAPESAQLALSALRLLHAQRHVDMARLLDMGHLQHAQVDLESRLLTALLRRLTAVVQGVEDEPSTLYDFTDLSLGGCLAQQIARLRAEGQEAHADHLVSAMQLLGLGRVDLELPADDDGAQAGEA